LSCPGPGRGDAVIELAQTPGSDPELQLLLRPRRALTASQFRGLFAVLVLAISLVAAASYSQGNVFAPLFALLDIAIVAWGLGWAWRAGERFEAIALDRQRLEVRCSGQSAPVFSAHPYWVRLSLAGQGGTVQVRLGSHGRSVEVGAFLVEAERRDLAQRLKELLAAASGRGWNQESTVG
jgi:uncharacterized membrane protein